MSDYKFLASLPDFRVPLVVTAIASLLLSLAMPALSSTYVPPDDIGGPGRSQGSGSRLYQPNPGTR